MTEFLELGEAIARMVQQGDRVALEGFTHLIPFAAGHEIIRQRIQDLTLIRMTPDLLYDQMIGSGCAQKLVFSWGGNPGVGSLHRLRDAVEQSWPRPLAIEEHSHAAMANAYAAGASGMPSAFFRGYRGSDLASVNPNIKFVPCPFTGESLACVPALRPDVAIVHAQKADRAGNVLVQGIIGVQKEAVLSARRALVTVEEVVDRFEGVGTNAVILPSWVVGAIAVVPGGAHPSYTHGYYDRDNAFYLAWDAISRDRDRFQAWMREHVIDAGPTRSGRGRTTGNGSHGNELFRVRDDDRCRRAGAGQRRHLFRRHRPALGGVQPRAVDARPWPDARVRVGHTRDETRRPAALDRRRRALRDRADDGVGAGDVSGTGCRAGASRLDFSAARRSIASET